jgi:hypothetical protein
MFTSEKLNAQDFLERLDSGKLSPRSTLFGKVKRSDNDSEILFAFKGDRSNWTPIPTNNIEHVHLIRSFTCHGEKMALVKLHLRSPSDPEAKLFQELLSALQAKVMDHYMKKMMMGSEGSNSCGCMKLKSESRCGHKSCEMEHKK